MEPNPGREVAVTLRLQAVPNHPDGLTPTACLRCGGSLEIHQPDASMPERMLATCESCKAWHLIECEPEIDPMVVVLLPGGEALRKALSG